MLLGIPFHRFALSGFYFVVFVTSFDSFRYYRRKVLRERLQAFFIFVKDREAQTRKASAAGGPLKSDFGLSGRPRPLYLSPVRFLPSIITLLKIRWIRVW